MKGLYYAILLVCISVLTFNCQKEISGTDSGLPGAGNNASPIKASVHGNIIDENGQPAASVTIKVGNKTVTTNAKGYFRINDASLDKEASVVIAEKAGYFKAYRSFQATNAVNYIKIKLLKKESAGSVNAASGGNVTLSNGTKITLPANGVVKTSGGAAYTGTINVYATYIDPTTNDIAQTVPGSFMADDKNNKRVNLTSYGMVAVELQSAAGEKLQIAGGSAATLTIPVPSSIQSSAPASIALWYLDEQTGIWKEEGIATKNGNNYTGEVKHFSFWNCDVGVPGINFSVILKNNEGIPIVHALVMIQRSAVLAGGFDAAYDYTDSCGKVSGLIPANETLVLTLRDDCFNVIYTQNIGPFAQNTNLGVITATAPGSSSLLTIKGRLKNCSNAIVTNGYAVVNFQNMPRNVGVNSLGEFATSFITCPGTTTCEIMGVDATAQQQGNVNTVNITVPVTNAGDIIACGTSALEFINYTLSSTSHSITSANGDSLMCYTYQTQSTPSLSTWATALKPVGGDYISLQFNHNAATGTYSLGTLSVQGYDSVALVQPFNIILTQFPAAVGGFYEGSFTGQFKEYGTVFPIYNINGTFRLRRL